MFFAPCRSAHSDFGRISNRTSGRNLIAVSVALALVAGLSAAPVFADELSDVSQLLRSGQQSAALSKADAFLKKNPKDAQMRFLKGVILTEQNKSADAIEVFAKLTEDYPSLPEPYNNLAVLYASSGQYEKARSALDKAIRTNPTYATAYENLGDVHAKLASQAYDKALQLDGSNSNAKSKLTMVHTLVGNKTGGTNPQMAALAVNPAPAKVAPQAEKVVPPAEAPVKSKPLEVAKSEPKQDATKEVKKEETPETKIAQQEKLKQEKLKEEKAQEAQAKLEAKQKAEAAAKAERDLVVKTVYAWAKQWSDRDVKGYLEFYARDFDLPKGVSRKDWEKERRARIEDKKRINVTIKSIQVSINGDTAEAKFHQIYDSNTFQASGMKVLDMKRQGSKWVITQEQSGS
tara:strand:+ start:277071 stop:278282 length:1212 start_codon:yes stop_codon:yes gene_type:complete